MKNYLEINLIKYIRLEKYVIVLKYIEENLNNWKKSWIRRLSYKDVYSS